MLQRNDEYQKKKNREKNVSYTNLPIGRKNRF